ncbi:MAG: hypothetical protein DWH84_00090 [Planctomycetota bacterium]|nr:MAG: hypothetical protein DWH84_00090 [Planctomycetota bacterium]
MNRLAHCFAKSLITACLSLLATGMTTPLVPAQSPMKFVHPGGVNNKLDLDFVKAKIHAGEQPWTGVFSQVKRLATRGTHELTHISSRNNDANISKDDARRAYANALSWYYTDDEVYAQQAITVLNAWSKLQGFNGGDDQDKLQAGWIGALFGPAAEIMRGYSGWAPEDMAKVQAMFKRAFYPQLKTASRWNGNVDLTQIDALLNIAVFNEDEAAFQLGIERLRRRNPAYFYLATDSAASRKIDGDGNNLDRFWSNPASWVNGLTQESCRDGNHHSQYAMASAFHAAEVAWNQGVDVYAENRERYTATLELMATQILTGTMQGTCGPQNDATSRDLYDTWEMGYNHYHNRMGIDLPKTKLVINSMVRTKGQSEWNIFYESLTHNLDGSTHARASTTPPASDSKPVPTANWPQFRGADSRGVASGRNLPDRWSATENVAWKTDIPGRGWSSPIVWGDRVFLTTVINTNKSEEPKKGLYFGGDRPKPPDAVHQWKVFCLDLKTGKVRWERQVNEGRPETPIHLKSSYASETPVTDGERVYCYFGNVGVFCFDLDGQEVWKHAIKPQATRFGWGTAASPVLHRDRLFLVNDNDQDSYLLALDAKTGEQVWRTPRDEKSNWATPFVWQNAQRTEIVTPGTDQVRSYDLDGTLLWSLKGMSSITIATPYEHKGLLYVTSGYVLDQTKPIYAIRPGATGDISLKAGETSNDFIAWSQPKAGPYNPSTLIFDDRLYVLYDMGLVRCLAANDGHEIFGQKRLPNARAFTSSPWAYHGKVFCLNEDGVTFVLKAGDEFEVLHTNSLAEDDMCMATPAIAGDRLLIRTSARVYCVHSAEAKRNEAGGK